MTMKIINISDKHSTFVDNEDYQKLSQYKWHILSMGGGKYPAVYRQNGKQIIYMHRQIMETPINLIVDHIDHNRLNNQKSNLRNCSRSQNAQNMMDNGEYQGVHWDTTHKKYRSRIRVSGARKHLGYFNNPSEAAICYNKAASKFYGEYARLNRISI